MKFTNREVGLTGSKLGGVPFIPKGGEYPTDVETGEKLSLLMQINFAEMPHIPDYPTEGLLQIFIAWDDDLYGCDLDDPLNQNKWRIIFHENISDAMECEDVLALMPEIDSKNCTLPMSSPEKEYGIAFEECDMPISYNDVSFAKAVTTHCESILPENMKDPKTIVFPKEMNDIFCDSLYAPGSRIGGYPEFTQDDPRGFKISDQTVLFLQIDSETTDDNGEEVIMWGDSGIANFFISPEDLKNKDLGRRIDKSRWNRPCCWKGCSWGNVVTTVLGVAAVLTAAKGKEKVVSHFRM